ncbi:MAG: hypothetical protein NXI31_04615 [bacterium]|nr:hypothetical protein [bacterium]
MSLVELASALQRSFDTSHGLLSRLIQGLRERRSAWVSARPDTIAPSADLESIAAELHAEDEVRRELMAELQQQLPAVTGVASTDARVNVSRIAAAIPRAAGANLREAADAATHAASAVRRELALGRRLLGFAQRAHDGLMADLASTPATSQPRGYDRSAQARSQRPVGARLIDGKM